MIIYLKSLPFHPKGAPLASSKKRKGS